ncbi:MAG: HNH endonuclease signature motif containing protein, partial [Candidatus Nanohaloarchaea archaeon]|nr:HNH endonuclease signature motif containing protein [Candidatus Nanohaloarchaea archaeon]
NSENRCGRGSIVEREAIADPQEILDELMYITDLSYLFLQTEAGDAATEGSYKAAASAFYRTYRAVMYHSYLEFVSSKSPTIKQEYIEYLENQVDTIPREARDGQRLPTEEMKEELPSECVGCGISRDIEYHHIIPHSCGGETTVENLAPLCGRCHDNIPPLEFGVWKHGLLDEAVRRSSGAEPL